MVDTALALAISGTVLGSVALLAICAIGVYMFLDGESHSSKSRKAEKMLLVKTAPAETSYTSRSAMDTDSMSALF
jgi:hypothetical protein